MRYDLVVPEIHVERQLIVNAMHPESGHVADNAFQRASNDELCRQKIREDPERMALLLIPAILQHLCAYGSDMFRPVSSPILAFNHLYPWEGYFR